MYKTYVFLLGRCLKKKIIQNTDWRLTGLYFLLLALSPFRSLATFSLLECACNISKDFFDVTLACDDDVQIKAHKVILLALVYYSRRFCMTMLNIFFFQHSSP